MKALKWILISLVAMIVLAFMFYAEEDWRGKRDWENYKRQLEASGETFDWSDYIPPTVPDAQNFFEAPKMQEWFIRDPDSNTHEFEVLFNDQKFMAIVSSASHGQPNLINSVATAEQFLDWSDSFEQEFNLIREASKRPFARMDGSYSDPYDRPVPDYTNVKLISYALGQRARSYLLIGQPQKALDELTLLDDIRRIYEAPPSGKPITLATVLIDAAICTVYQDVVAYGIQSHLWQEPQLETVEKQLEQIDLSIFMKDALREERAALCYKITIEVIGKIDPNRSNIARGWLCQNLVTLSKWYQQAIDGIDISNKIVAPDAVIRVDNELKEVDSSRFQFLSHPYSFWTAVLMPNLPKAIETFAWVQTLVSEAQIACALERYRLAHGQYPETLNALVPQYMQTIPHDIIGGQPLHYRRTDDGKFQLYSIGWNEQDDGGQPSPRNENGVIDYTKGDWVWPN